MYKKILFRFVCTLYKEYLNLYTKYPIHSDYTEAEFLDEIQTEVLRVFLLAFHSHLYSFALRYLYFFKLPQPLTDSKEYTVKEKGGKPDRKPHPMV
jgi:hypothetical protein